MRVKALSSAASSIALGFAAVSASFVVAAPAAAQETTSAVRGSVTAPSGPVAGASVTITHTPSGTVFSATTDSDGTFSANGLRVGGPFTVEVTAEGYESATVNDLFLQAGQPFRLPVVLQEQAAIVVSANRLSGALATSTGPITALSREAIEGVASVNRDVRDLARRDPFATMDLSNSRTIEIAGQNGRLNRFSVDGVQMSDDFGLNNGGLPTSRGPVPLDAIEQFSVKVAPFDITEGDFQGGAINVVMRSGGNDFKGSGFFSYTSDSLTGDRTRGLDVNLDFDSKQFGGFVSGPLIRDKLFFMAAYERTKESDPFDFGPQGAGFASPIPNLTQAMVDQVSNIAKTVYNYDTLGLLNNGREEDEKIVAKLDWNVSDDHRASLTYIRNVGTQGNQRNTNTSTATPSIGLTSDGYELSEEINTGVFQLNSTWSDAFSTELRASYRDYNRGQVPYGATTLGEISVCTDPLSVGSVSSCTATPTGSPRIVFGPDAPRHANKLNTSNLNIDLTTKLELGDHSIKAIFGYTKTKVFNLFLQNYLGTFYFDSIADFQNRRANRLTYANAVPSLNVNDAAASFATETFTIGLQDDWQVTDNFQLTAGGRFDLFNNDVRPALNANFTARNGFSNKSTLTGRFVFQPRVGFNWDAKPGLIIKGGVGVFAGGTPDVFLSNSFSNTGQLTNQFTFTRSTAPAGCDVPTTGLTAAQAAAICAAALNNVSLTSIPTEVQNYIATNTSALANAPVNAIDPNLKIARQLRATLSADYEADLGPLGSGWLFGANFLYGNVLQGYSWTDVRSVASGRKLPDGRDQFINAPGTSGVNQDLLMTNGTRGRSYIGVVRFEKGWDWGLKIGGSYTRSDVTDESPITSTTAGSLYNNTAFDNPNLPAYGRSIYEIRNQWKFNIDFKKEFIADAETRISLFGEIRSGRPYSLTMLDTSGVSSSARGIVFGTVGTGGRHLLYVPTTNDSRVSFDSAATQTAFDAQVAALGLEKYRGRVVPKNSQTSPSFFKLDLHVSQEIPLPMKTKLELFADVENVLNLIDSDWGALRQVAFPYAASLISVQCLNTTVATGTAPTAAQINTSSSQTCAQYRYSAVTAPNVDRVSRQSLYGIRVGARLSF